jgi:hypothetical protein
MLLTDTVRLHTARDATGFGEAEDHGRNVPARVRFGQKRTQNEARQTVWSVGTVALGEAVEPGDLITYAEKTYRVIAVTPKRPPVGSEPVAWWEAAIG